MLPFLYPVTLIVQHGSLLTTVAVALERYITICQPFNYNPVSVLRPNFRYYEMGYYKIWFNLLWVQPRDGEAIYVRTEF